MIYTKRQPQKRKSQHYVIKTSRYFIKKNVITQNDNELRQRVTAISLKRAERKLKIDEGKSGRVVTALALKARGL